VTPALTLQVNEDMLKPKHQRFFLHAELPTASSDRMLLVCAHPSMLQWAAAYGDKRVVSMDSTFNVTQYSYSLLTATVVDHDGKGKPAMFAVLSSECADDIAEALQVFDTHVNELKPGWRPSAFMIDDSDAERNGIGCAAVFAIQTQPPGAHA
jgi:alkanesulfonate monooxygenase SsuD/methylene tetrahydromethanopterin reductase-like flavin-dependent oxidoreductase (luciferase family)